MSRIFRKLKVKIVNKWFEFLPLILILLILIKYQNVIVGTFLYYLHDTPDGKLNVALLAILVTIITATLNIYIQLKQNKKNIQLQFSIRQIESIKELATSLLETGENSVGMLRSLPDLYETQNRLRLGLLEGVDKTTKEIIEDRQLYIDEYTEGINNNSRKVFLLGKKIEIYISGNRESKDFTKALDEMVGFIQYCNVLLEDINGKLYNNRELVIDSRKEIEGLYQDYCEIAELFLEETKRVIEKEYLKF